MTEPGAAGIRRAAPADAEPLSAIARRAKAHWGYPEAWLREWDPILRLTPEYLETHLVFAIHERGGMVGFYALEDRGPRWSLEHFWVDPAHQGRGAGRRLFAHTLETVRARRPGVLVIEADPNAVGFYVRMGAVPAGSVPAPMEGDASRTLPVLEIHVEG